MNSYGIPNNHKPSVVSDMPEANHTTRRSQFNSLFSLYECEIGRLENQVCSLVKEANNLKQIQSQEYLSYHQNLLVHAKFNEKLFQDNQNCLKVNEELLSENKRLKSILSEKDIQFNGNVQINREFGNSNSVEDSQIDKSKGVDKLNHLINDLKDIQKLASICKSEYNDYNKISTVSLPVCKLGKVKSFSDSGKIPSSFNEPRNANADNRQGIVKKRFWRAFGNREKKVLNFGRKINF